MTAAEGPQEAADGVYLAGRAREVIEGFLARDGVQVREVHVHLGTEAVPDDDAWRSYVGNGEVTVTVHAYVPQYDRRRSTT